MSNKVKSWNYYRYDEIILPTYEQHNINYSLSSFTMATVAFLGSPLATSLGNDPEMIVISKSSLPSNISSLTIVISNGMMVSLAGIMMEYTPGL